MSNLLQTIETILDSETQKDLKKREIDRTRLRHALTLTRALQHRVCGKHFVEERTIKAFLNPNEYQKLSTTNWPEFVKRRELAKNRRLQEYEK